MSLSDVEWDGGVATSVEVTINVPGLLATNRVWSHGGFADLLRFFEGMADDWRGWDGERSYESLEGDLRLSARHDGHMRLVVELREWTGPTGWTARADLILDPGEEATQTASSLRSLLVVR